MRCSVEEAPGCYFLFFLSHLTSDKHVLNPHYVGHPRKRKCSPYSLGIYGPGKLDLGAGGEVCAGTGNKGTEAGFPYALVLGQHLRGVW